MLSSLKIKGMLVVDDCPNMRELLRDVLEADGCYPVFDAEDGVEAMSFLSEHGAQIEGMILDLTMPRMRGDEVLTKLRTVHDGQLAVILMSGHATVEATVEAVQDPRLHLEFLHKPFEMVDLLKRVESVVLRKREAEQKPA